MFTPDVLSEIRSKCAHVDVCPFQGPRVFFENAGGALTLNAAMKQARGLRQSQTIRDETIPRPMR